MFFRQRKAGVPTVLSARNMNLTIIGLPINQIYINLLHENLPRTCGEVIGVEGHFSNPDLRTNGCGEVLWYCMVLRR